MYNGLAAAQTQPDIDIESKEFNAPFVVCG